MTTAKQRSAATVLTNYTFLGYFSKLTILDGKTQNQKFAIKDNAKYLRNNIIDYCPKLPPLSWPRILDELLLEEYSPPPFHQGLNSSTSWLIICWVFYGVSGSKNVKHSWWKKSAHWKTFVCPRLAVYGWEQGGSED